MINQLKQTVICKAVNEFNQNPTEINTYIPKVGDVGFFEVIELGKHTRLQMTDGKNHRILPGDVFMATFGSRYATAQLEGKIPEKIYPEYHILGQGGVVGIMNAIHRRYEHKGPTRVRLIAYATDGSNEIINTKYYHKPEIEFSGLTLKDTEIILSIGGSMDSGKTKKWCI